MRCTEDIELHESLDSSGDARRTSFLLRFGDIRSDSFGGIRHEGVSHDLGTVRANPPSGYMR